MQGIGDWWWRGLGALGLTLILLTTTARLTLLDAGFDARAVGEVDGYDRVYSQLLPEPAVQEAIRASLSGLPVDPTYLTANLRLLVPPSVLEEVVHQAVAEYLDVVLGHTDRMDLGRVLQPVVDHLVLLVQGLAPGSIATAPRVRATSLKTFEAHTTALFTHLAAGQLVLHLPTVRVQPGDVGRVADILTAGLPLEIATELQPQLIPLLTAGDLSAAFALVVPSYLDSSALQQIGAQAQRAAARAFDAQPTGIDGKPPHQVLPLGLRWLTAIGALLSAACLLPLLRARSRLSRELALILGTTVVMSLVVGVLIARQLEDPLIALARGPAVDPTARQLLLDLDQQLRDGVLHMFLGLTAALAVAAVVAWLAPRLRRSAQHHWQPLAATVSTAVLGATALVILVVSTTRPPLVCNGSSDLCDRGYNQVTYLTAHNAMASSDRGFLAADQDPDITAQLDNGVRGLMLDLHYWTPPTQAAPYLASLDDKTRAAWAPLLRNFQPRPGVWLCHEACQLGADPAVTQLKALRGWLSSHPADVVTLILQDNVSPADVRATITAAGLDPWLATPPASGDAWPTLRQMIDDHHTLVVFTQDAKFADGPIRNFYQLAAETPYAAKTRVDLRCDPGRGPASAPLFLVNNWIAVGVPRRGDALRVNSPSFLLPRLRQCETERGMRATFVAVNFAQVGHPLTTVDRLNTRMSR